jgi:hypothetical protein
MSHMCYKRPEHQMAVPNMHVPVSTGKLLECLQLIPSAREIHLHQGMTVRIMR